MTEPLAVPLPPEPAAPAPIDVQWLGCDLTTGRIIEELTGVTPSGVLARRLGAHTSAQIALPLPAAPPAWEAATQPGRSLLVALADGDPVWAGIVLTRRGGSAETLTLGCATPEAYLDRRYTRDHVWTERDESSVIAAGLIGDVMVDGIALTVDAPPTGTLRTRTYKDADDATVLSRLQELMDVQGGPEWTIDVRWADSSRTRVELVARVRRRIGGPSGAVFVLPGDVVSYELLESYEAGRGANVTLARGNGEGDTRASSAEMVDAELIAAGMPRWEHRWTPSTSLTSQDVLDGHATHMLELMRLGTQVWTMTAVAHEAPRLGRDWRLGDDVTLHVLSSPRHPGGVLVTARAWAWEWDVLGGRISPILAED